MRNEVMEFWHSLGGHMEDLLSRRNAQWANSKENLSSDEELISKIYEELKNLILKNKSSLKRAKVRNRCFLKVYEKNPHH